jgi:1-acyl-sn-glycerol-3-phosphate acyltransferase
LKKIVSHIFFVWFALCFAGLFLAFYPLFLIFLAHPFLYPVANVLRKIWAWLVLFLGFSFPFYKRYKAPVSQPCIYVANHSSYLDIVAFGLFFPLKSCFMAKAELAKIPLFGIFFRTVDIAVERQSIRGSHRSFVSAAQRLDQGYNVIVFPEGTISSHAPQMKSFKNGAFKLAIEKGVSIVPVTFYNNFKILPNEKFEFYPQFLKFKIHRPISTNHLNIEQADELKTKIYRIIEDDLKSIK